MLHTVNPPLFSLVNTFIKCYKNCRNFNLQQNKSFSLRDPWLWNKDNTTFTKIIKILYSINVDITLYFILLTINVNFFISILYTPIFTLFTRKLIRTKASSHQNGFSKNIFNTVKARKENFPWRCKVHFLHHIL
jgi:hypothetical protein